MYLRTKIQNRCTSAVAAKGAVAMVVAKVVPLVLLVPLATAVVDSKDLANSVGSSPEKEERMGSKAGL